MVRNENQRVDVSISFTEEDIQYHEDKALQRVTDDFF
jgi:hypothetical protein